MGLLDDAELNVRLFALPSGLPPHEWHVRTYVTANKPDRLDPRWRRRLLPRSRTGQRVRKAITLGLLGSFIEQQERWLASIINRWKPHVIHTFGLDPTGDFYLRVLQGRRLRWRAKWVAQIRGGPDLALRRLFPEHASRIRSILGEADQVVADNPLNLEYACALGMSDEKVQGLGVVSGVGGIDVDRLADAWPGPPSTRQRLILIPKAYEGMQNKTLPILEALRLAWDWIQPCEVHLLATIAETETWFQTLPQGIRDACRTSRRVPRHEVLDRMLQARVMLAPSLIDGTPNVMFEAMAAGAFPILSPLETITPLMENEQNVLFARNLYPSEIAEALVRAMGDDALVDRAAERNLELVRRIADRKTIKPRVVAFYQQLAEGG
jgi:glycosyltransferase involved in cell wall biosynthesis